MRPASFLAVLALLLPFAVPAQAPAPPGPTMPASHPPVDPVPHAKEAPSPWSEMADYTLTVKVPPKGESGTWKFRTFADPADVVVDFDTPAAKGRTKGSIILVNGQAIATRGFTPEAGFELDPLDSAIVNLKMLTRLLDAAMPGGPVVLKGKQAVTARSDKMPLTASTPTATMQFSAPWSLEGTIERVDANTIAYELALDVPGGGKASDRVRWNYSGTASGAAKGRVMEDSMNLAGWTACTLGPPKSAKQGHATLKFGATRLPGPFATLGDLRAFLAKPAQAP